MLERKKYVASCSFGKDSVAQVILAKENNEPLDEIVYCEVMFDKDTSAELPIHADFIHNVAIPTFESWGYKVTVLRPKNTYVDLFYKITTKSKVESRNGKYRGFPLSRGCHMNSGAKIKAIKEYWKENNNNVMQYVGIAIDETERLERVHKSDNQMSLLEKYQFTEEMAKAKCIEYNLLSPIYAHTKRNGCWFCPNCSIEELKLARNGNRNMWNKLLEMSKQELSNPYFNAFKKQTFQDVEDYLRNEEAQMTIWDFIGKDCE